MVLRGAVQIVSSSRTDDGTWREVMPKLQSGNSLDDCYKNDCCQFTMTSSDYGNLGRS
jgi:hypothetical protein